MHVQGSNRGSKIAQVGEVYHEGNGVHEAKVIKASAHTATLEYLNDGREITVCAGEFDEIFTY
jgi:6-phosphogluconolactonase (cycloisomerase 2 family)